MLASHTKLSFGAGGLGLYTPVINLIISGWSFSDWYGATVIPVAKTHFALTIALYETPLSYRLLKKFKNLFNSYASSCTCKRFPLIYILYIVLVPSRNDAFNILTVVSLLP